MNLQKIVSSMIDLPLNDGSHWYSAKGILAIIICASVIVYSTYSLIKLFVLFRKSERSLNRIGTSSIIILSTALLVFFSWLLYDMLWNGSPSILQLSNNSLAIKFDGFRPRIAFDKDDIREIVFSERRAGLLKPISSSRSTIELHMHSGMIHYFRASGRDPVTVERWQEAENVIKRWFNMPQ